MEKKRYVSSIAIILMICAFLLVKKDVNAQMQDDTLSSNSLANESATLKYGGTSGKINWSIDTEGHLSITGEGDYEKAVWPNQENGWWKYSNEIKTASVDVSGITSTAYMFYSCTYLTQVDLTGLDTSLVTDMNGMFQGCSSMIKLDLSQFDTSKVTYMGGMFSDCNRLESVDLSSFNTSAVTSMSSMFSKCYKLSQINLNGFDTSSVTDMSNMFIECSSLNNLNLSNFQTSNVLDMRYMFSGCSKLEEINLCHFDTSNVSDMNSMFSGCSSLKNLDVSGFDTSNVTDMGYMFSGCQNLIVLKLGQFRTDAVCNMAYLFSGCISLENLDVSQFETGHATNMEYMFHKCSSLTNLDVSRFHTECVTNMEGMFWGCGKVTSLNVRGFNTLYVKDMSSMFSECSSLQFLDVSTFNTENVIDMTGMFSRCSGLVNLDVSGFNTRCVTNMNGMFFGCSSLTSLTIGEWDTRAVTDMSNMFSECTRLIGLDLCHLDMDAVTNANNMFNGCDDMLEIQSPKNIRMTVALPMHSWTDRIWFDSAGNEYDTMIEDLSYSVQYSRKAQWLTEKTTVIKGEEEKFYTGKAIHLVLEVSYHKNLLQAGRDYSVTYKNNIKPGTATFTVTGQGKYTGSIMGEFRIVNQLERPQINSLKYSYKKGSLSSLEQNTFYSLYIDFFPVNFATSYSIELSDIGGKKIKTVKVKPKKTATYIMKNIGNLDKDVYGVRIRAQKGKNYSKWSEKAYIIKQPKAQARSYKGSIQIRWEKLTGVSGYDIYMSKKKNGTFVKVASVGKDTTTKTIQKFNRKKISKGTYYYYVLAKKKSGKKTFRSDLSYISKVKINA